MPRDHIREFYEAGGYVKPRNRKAEALSRVRDGYAGGGTIRKGVKAAAEATDALRRWFGKSLVTDEAGAPKLVYRGEHGPTDTGGLQSRLGSLSFGDQDAANLYALNPNNRQLDPMAQSPRVTPAYLRIERPFINDPDDPFLEGGTIANALGPEVARNALKKFENYVYNTNNWNEEIARKGDYYTVGDFLKKNPEGFKDLYFDAYPALDDPELVNRLRAAGYDGAIHGGMGDTALTPEYKIFDKEQAWSPWGGQFAKGGKAVKKAAQLFHDYADPAAKLIGDWTWRPLQDVARDLKITGPSNFSPEVQNYGDFMRKMAARASGEGLSPEDLMKSYAITRSSMGRSAINPGKLIDAGLDVPPGEMIRPEGAMAYWLRSPAGRQYLEEAAHTGQVDPKISQGLTSLMTPFGKQNEYPDILNWGAQNLPGREGRTSELVARASQDASSPVEWLDLMANTRGIKPAKQGFWSSLMGRGDMPTFDARQIILNTGLSSAEGAGRTAHPAKAAEAVQRLRSRMEGLDYQGPDWMQPFYPHLAHHETWDRSAGEATTHQDLIDTMLARATGGRVGYDIGGPTLAGLTGAAKKAGTTAGKVSKFLQDLWSPPPPTWQSPVEQAAIASGTTQAEIERLIRKAPWMGGESKSQAISMHVPNRPYSDVSVMRGPYASLMPERIVRPEDFKGGRIIGTVGDRLLTDEMIYGLNGQMFNTPVRTYGGPKYVRGTAGHTGSGWASDKAPVGGYINLADKAMAEGLRPWMTPLAMGRKAIDSTNEMQNIIGQMMLFNRAPTDAVEAFNKEIRTQFPKFPGLAHPDMPAWQAALPTSQRSKMPLMLDKSAYAKLGLPDVGDARLALTDEGVMAAPKYSSGSVFFEPDTSLGRISNPDIPHPNYSTQMAADYTGGFGRHVPAEVMFADDYAARMRKEAPDRSIMMSPLTQDVNQRWIDRTSKWLEEADRRGLPKARGGRVGYADGGDVTPAIGVEGIKGLMNLIKKASGLKQARRFEDAADVTNLKPYSEQALLDTFARPESVYGAVKPSEFERYAYPLDPNYAQITPKSPGEKPWYAAEGSKPDLGIGSYDDYLSYLRGIAQEGGFSAVPELHVGARGLSQPVVTTHDGRHRMRALRDIDDTPSLVEFKPDFPKGALTWPSLPRMLRRGQIEPQNAVSEYDTVRLPDLFAFGGSV